MSSSNSNLSNPNLGYDMVVGLTQNSMNSTMKQYLNAANDNPDSVLEPVYYAYDPNNMSAGPLPISYEDLVARCGGVEVDPFLIPDGTTNNSGDPSAQLLYDARFAFAFQATMGLPTGVAPSHIPDIITLQGEASYQEVTYQMFYKTFQIVQMNQEWGDWEYQNIQQPDNDPWIFNWIVNLNLESADFNSLPQSTQDSVKNLDNSTMFSVQQLMLDLSTPALGATQPTVSGLSPDANRLLLNDFIGVYWRDLNANGGVIFSAAIQSQDPQPNPEQPSLIPTDLDFIVTPYPHDCDEGVDPTPEEQGLYTLNYLIMGNNSSMPSPVHPMSWNWLNSSEDQEYDGVMSIKKSNFVDYLNSLLSPCLKDICIQPTVDMSLKDVVMVEYTWGYTYPTPTPTYQVVSDSGDPSRVLSCHYRSDNAHDSLFGQGDITIWNEVQADIYLTGNTIRCVTTAAVYLNVGLAGMAGIELSHTKGYIYADKNTTTYTMTVTQDGRLQVEMDATDQDLRQSTDKNGDYYDGDLNASWFAEMSTLGNINDLVAAIQDYYTDAMSSFMVGYDLTILQLLNDTQAWVFPGAQTFTYDNCHFSNHQDLLTMISYADLS